MNSSGLVVGYSYDDDIVTKAVRWNASNPDTATELLPLDGDVEATALAVNEGDFVVGLSQDEAFENHGVYWRGSIRSALKTPSGFPESVAIDCNDPGQIVGYAESAETRVAMFWNADDPMGVAIPIPDDSSSTATGINNAGVVVGTFFPTGSETNHLYRWSQDDRFEDLGVPVGSDAIWSFATAGPKVNDLGEIVLTGLNTEGLLFSAHRWTEATGFERLTWPGDPDAPSTANAINNSGVIIGDAPIDGDAVQAVTWPTAAVRP